MYKVEYYMLPNGRVPVEDFIDGLPDKNYARNHSMRSCCWKSTGRN